jgi:SET domain-containing protein 6
MEFQADSDHFMSWLAGQKGVTISNKIALADLRAVGAGRGVGMAESPYSENFLHMF